MEVLSLILYGGTALYAPAAALSTGDVTFKLQKRVFIVPGQITIMKLGFPSSSLRFYPEIVTGNP